jgi:hypothetical protein
LLKGTLVSVYGNVGGGHISPSLRWPGCSRLAPYGH